MSQVYEISDGRVFFEESKVVIDDKESGTLRWLWVMSVMSLFVGFVFVLKDESVFLFWAGVSIMIGHAAVIFLLWRSTDKAVIDYQAIERIEAKERFGNKYISIKLKSGKTRSIRKAGRAYQEIKAYIEQAFA